MNVFAAVCDTDGWEKKRYHSIHYITTGRKSVNAVPGGLMAGIPTTVVSPVALISLFVSTAVATRVAHFSTDLIVIRLLLHPCKTDTKLEPPRYLTQSKVARSF